MTQANMWLVFKIAGILLWIFIIICIGMVLYYIWEDMNND